MSGELVDRLRAAGNRAVIEVEGHRLTFTNLNKVLWPPIGATPAVTKRNFLVYLAEISSYLLPHLKDRPLTTIRMPNGIRGTRFFQKQAHHQPPFVDTVQLTAKVAGELNEYVVCNNLASLLWLGQLGSLELHASYARVSPEPDAQDLIHGVRPEEVADWLFDYPDFLVFDLDPYIYAGSEREGEEPVLNRPAFQKTAEIALRLKELLAGLGLEAFVKTTGKTGLHIFAPILRTADYTTVRAVATDIAARLIEHYPDEVTMEWDVEKRPGKVFLDVNQNVRAKTVAAIFSTRGVPQAAVSMPLRWDEVARVYPTDFTIRSVVARLEREGDPWAGILDAKRALPAERASMPRAS